MRLRTSITAVVGQMRSLRRIGKIRRSPLVLYCMDFVCCQHFKLRKAPPQ